MHSKMTLLKSIPDLYRIYLEVHLINNFKENRYK